MIQCIECGRQIRLPREVTVDAVIECPHCGTRFVVLDVDPLEIDYLEEGDDWDDDWEAVD